MWHIGHLILSSFYCILLFIVTGTDEVAGLYRDLKSLSDELSEGEQSISQQAATTVKVAACRDKCYSAFRLLGKERKEYEDRIESLETEIKTLRGNSQQVQGTGNVGMYKWG